MFNSGFVLPLIACLGLIMFVSGQEVKPISVNPNNVDDQALLGGEPTKVHSVPFKGACTQFAFEMEDCSNLVTSLTSQVIGTSIKAADNIKCHELSLPEHCKIRRTKVPKTPSQGSLKLGSTLKSDENKEGANQQPANQQSANQQSANVPPVPSAPLPFIAK